MKISKLFHWLYALLMFLPIMFFLPSCIYYGFNEHANANITRDTNVSIKQYVINGLPSSNLNNINVTSEGNLYYSNGYAYFDAITDVILDYEIDNFTTSTNEKLYCSFTCYSDSASDFICYIDDVTEGGDLYYEFSLNDNETKNISFIIDTDNFILELNSVSFFQDITPLVFGTKNVQLFNLTEIFGVGNEPTKEEFESYLTQDYYEYGVDYEITVTKGYNISDSINEAWNHVWELPLFSWTHNSFVSVPFSYITSLFGVAQNSTLNYTLTYFASVSMIWLVFDLLMYVPLLCHRWLDKGVVE